MGAAADVRRLSVRVFETGDKGKQVDLLFIRISVTARNCMLGKICATGRTKCTPLRKPISCR